MLQASPAAQWPAAPGEADARCGVPLARVKQALARFGDGRPALVIDVARVRYNARRFAAAMPSVRPHYAVKANSDRRVLQALAQQGVGFEIASSTELDLVRRSACRRPRSCTAIRCGPLMRSNMRRAGVSSGTPSTACRSSASSPH